MYVNEAAVLVERGLELKPDPLEGNPLVRSRYYAVKVQRLIGAILLGIMTYDANLLVIEPRPAAR